MLPLFVFRPISQYNYKFSIQVETKFFLGFEPEATDPLSYGIPLSMTNVHLCIAQYT